MTVGTRSGEGRDARVVGGDQEMRGRGGGKGKGGQGERTWWDGMGVKGWRGVLLMAIRKGEGKEGRRE